LERRSWSVRPVRRGLLLGGHPHRRQQVLFGRRGGERRQLVAKKREHPRPANSPDDFRGHVLRSVQRPVHVNRHYTFDASRQVARSERHRGRANSRKREEPAPGSIRADGARLAARHGLARDIVTRQKRKGVAASVPARNRELGSQCPYVVVVAEVVGRRSISNTLAPVLQKERQRE
jgi:hypothetical protein